MTGLTKYGVPAAIAAFCIAGLAAIWWMTAAPRAQSRHDEYYYPIPESREAYVSRARALDEADRARRIGFVNALTLQMSQQSYASQYAIFAKGTDAEKLIIVGYGDGQFNTLYRARALFATMTTFARMTPLFQEYEVEDWFTFFDLAKMLGFTQITISDGGRFAHQVSIQ